MALTKYITADEFRDWTGIDLAKELKDTNNPSNKVDAFLRRVEVRMESYMNARFFKNISDLYPEFSNFQKDQYKLALLEQAFYVYHNGDIYADSGYDPDKGIIASKHALSEITIAPAAIDHLRMCGLWTAHIAGKGFFGPWVA